jgi:DNA-binding transcriptional regulator LsrR (DeoR family)
MASRSPGRRNGRPRPDERLRLMTKVARLYHEHGVRQPEIARRLHISQARVSRLLKQAEEEGIVRTTVVIPAGVQTGLEDALEEAYGLREAVVVESMDTTDDGVIYDLGVAAGAYLEMTLTGGDVVGMSSWSATLLAAVDAMRPLSRTGAQRVVQLMGGVGNPSAEAHAARLTQRFAELTGAQPTFLLAPGIASSAQAHDVLLKEPVVRDAMSAINDVTLALVGIGSLEPSTLLQSSGNIFPDKERRLLGKRGAVGDICLRLIDAEGRAVPSDVDKRVIGVTLDQLARSDRSVGVAGGPRKYEAIRAALLGHWVNVLITDQVTAERLIADRPTASSAAAGGPSRSTA